jgi:hypothetical protein
VTVATKSTKRSGPPRRPTERTRALGDPGHRGLAPVDQVPTLPAAKATPKPPRPLKASGSKLWERAWRDAITWLSPDSDIELLLIVCELLDERDALRKRVMANASSPDIWRDRAGLRALDKQVIDGLALLGFSPTDRARLGVAEVKQEDELAAFRRQAGR